MKDKKCYIVKQSEAMKTKELLDFNKYDMVIVRDEDFDNVMEKLKCTV